MFLQAQQFTQATIARDYPEWHHDRERYALWYIEIQDPALSQYLQHLRQHFSGLLYQPNHRQFHISLFICGFRCTSTAQYNDDFLDAQFQQQCSDLSQASLASFPLQTGRICSFDSALFVEVLDPTQQLARIRQILSASAAEIAAPHYCAHVTLGVYQDAYPYAQVSRQIAAVEQQCFEFNVQQLCFGDYQAQQLQGRLDPQYVFELQST